jgi:choice-of-anchor B domain-containing protein
MISRVLITALSFAGVLLTAACSSSNSGTGQSPPPPPPPPPAGLSTGPANCVGGLADDFGCSGITLRSRVPAADMGDATGGNDIWGWGDSQSGDEYALVGLQNGTAFVNVTDPENPVVVGRLPTNTTPSIWRDIKVYQDYAYVVADAAGAHGLQVFDLTRLRGSPPGQTFTADAVYSGFTNAHNIAINEDTARLYAVGTNTCNEGLHIVSLADPVAPMMLGCHADADTHDTQCVVYQGPDADYAGREICFSSNGNHVGIADVTDAAATTTIFSAAYPQTGFTHQGWLTEDQRFFLFGDELDESNLGVPTRTHIFDMADLDSPVYISAYEAATTAIDHNLYILGNRVYEANYSTGLRVLEFQDLSNSEIQEVAYFDTYPDDDATSFEGMWSVYPYLPSGNIIANDRTNGLFVLTMQ